MKQKEEYIIKGGVQGSERLKKLTKSTWKVTKKHVLKAGLKKGLNLIDIGCGNGLITQKLKRITGKNSRVSAFDFDKDIISIAKNLNENKPEINFFEFNLSENDLNQENKYDFAFVRFFLSHITNPEEVLGRIKKLLKKGGVLYVEDVDFTAYFSCPQNDAFDTYVRMYEQLGFNKGANPHIGLKLYEMLIAQNFSQVKVHSTSNCFTQGVGKEIALITMEAISEGIIKNKLMTEFETREIIEKLRVFTNTENAALSLPRIFFTVPV